MKHLEVKSILELVKVREEQSTDYVELVPEHIVKEYVEFLEIKSEIKKQYYFNLLKDFFLFHGKAPNWISQKECLEYFNYLERVQTYHQTSIKTLRKKVRQIIRFIHYLNQLNVIPFNLDKEDKLEKFSKQRSKSPKKNVPQKKRKSVKKQKVYPKIVSDFVEYLDKNNYATNKYYRKHILLFSRFLESKGIDINLFYEPNKENLLFNKIKEYEEMLSIRITREEILKGSASIYLRSVQLFVKFLFSKRLVSKLYSLPIHLRGRGIRANEYVSKNEIIALMNAIYDHSNQFLRDLAIFLIIVDTGSRPIEVANLVLEDLDLIENTLRFECNKTEQRIIKISPKVMGVIKDYLRIRERYSTTGNNLFMNVSGDPLTSSCINTIFYLANKNAFGGSKFPPKAFRHTFITNALDQYSLLRVSKVIGHKDWKSTYYYVYRSKEKLLKNTLKFNPLIKEG